MWGKGDAEGEWVRGAGGAGAGTGKAAASMSALVAYATDILLNAFMLLRCFPAAADCMIGGDGGGDGGEVQLACALSHAHHKIK